MLQKSPSSLFSQWAEEVLLSLCHLDDTWRYIIIAPKNINRNPILQHAILTQQYERKEEYVTQKIDIIVERWAF